MQIVSDRGMDLAPEQMKGIEIHLVPLTLTFEGKTYRSGEDIQPDEFYQLISGSPNFPTTSQPSPGDFADVFRKLAATDPEILSLRVDESLYFPNARFLEDLINGAVAANPAIRHVILECPAVIEDDPAAHIAPGDVLSNRYRIECFLARGGMGDVFRAFDGELGAPVALKTIRPDIARGPHALDRIRREILIARSISHPNVCRTYDLGRDAARDMSFLTMEYLAGETLSARLRRAGPLVKETAMLIVQQVAEALKTTLARFKGLTGTGKLSDRGLSRGAELKAPPGADPLRCTDETAL